MKRTGKTMIEMMAVIAVLSTVLGVSAKTFSYLMRADAGGRAAVAEAVNRSQLAARFRRDVHAATQAAPADAANPGTILRLTGPDGVRIEYRIKPKRLEIVEVRGANSRILQTFRLDKPRIRCEVSNDSPRSVALLISTGATPPAATSATALPRQVVRLVAVPGRDYRFTRKPKSKGKP